MNVWERESDTGARYKWISGKLWTDYEFARSAAIWSRIAVALLVVDLLARVLA